MAMAHAWRSLENKETERAKTDIEPAIDKAVAIAAIGQSLGKAQPTQSGTFSNSGYKAALELTAQSTTVDNSQHCRLQLWIKFKLVKANKCKYVVNYKFSY